MLKNKFKLFYIAMILILILPTTCFALTSSKDVKFEVVEDNVCTINIQDIAKFEKKIISKDLEKKEITLNLKVTNTAEPTFFKPTEIFFVIDNSLSMRDAVTTTLSRLDVIADSAKRLSTELLKNDKVEIGIVTFSTGDNEGTLSDAKLLLNPTSNKTTIDSSIDSISAGQFGPRTNIDAGLTLASQYFSSDCESKYIILLTDGVPNTAVGGPTFTYSFDTATKTKAKLQSVSESGINIFSVMTGVPNVEEPSTGITYKELAEEIFGTTDEPTVGRFYYIPDSEIEKTVCESIFEDFSTVAKNTLTNLKIYDYFPQQIVDNFDFSYVTDATKGTISPSIDLENNCIIWTIDKLEPKETINVSYKLSLKENVDEKILGVILNTNEKVEITANEIKTTDGSNVLKSDVSPKVRVSSLKDNTVANTTIPQTGITSTPLVITILFVTVLAFIGIRFYISNRDIK